MKIQVDFYKPSGKWYTGGAVEIGNTKLYDNDFKQKIVDNQDHMAEGWQGRYVVVTSALPADELDDDFKGFFNSYFSTDSFAGMTKGAGK